MVTVDKKIVLRKEKTENWLLTNVTSAMSLLLPGKRSLTPKRYIVRNPLEKSRSDCDSLSTFNNKFPILKNCS
jgi:hypothetical protein